MDNEQKIALGCFDPNPFQTREGEDPEHVAKIAVSILVNGLLQPPVGRFVGQRVQLAFGHTRLAAFRLIQSVLLSLAAGKGIVFENDSSMAQVVLLADQALEAGRDGVYDTMPVVLRELDDEQMFRFAVSENLDRADLSAIEQARAMQVYRERFGKTSAEIGELFGLKESTVRGKMRLLNLPNFFPAVREIYVLQAVTPELHKVYGHLARPMVLV